MLPTKKIQNNSNHNKMFKLMHIKSQNNCSKHTKKKFDGKEAFTYTNYISSPEKCIKFNQKSCNHRSNKLFLT